MPLPHPYRARSYRGPVDHPAMAEVLSAYNRDAGMEAVTAGQIDASYANLVNSDPATDIALIEDAAGTVVGYARVQWDEMEDGSREFIVFNPIHPAHLTEALHRAAVAAEEAHLRAIAAGFSPATLRSYAPHPGPGLAATGPSAWLEAVGYRAVRFGAGLVRPHLDDIPDQPLPDGVEVRSVAEDQIRTIWDAHQEAFRGEFGFVEPVEEEFNKFRDNPLRDESLWKIAWAGDVVVGQVKSYINHDENARVGTLRGYTEEISTHRDWRNQGIAAALLAASLRELRDRGMTEAALGADTENPGGAFHLYQRLGFEIRSYEAVYTKPM